MTPKHTRIQGSVVALSVVAAAIGGSVAFSGTASATNESVFQTSTRMPNTVRMTFNNPQQFKSTTCDVYAVGPVRWHAWNIQVAPRNSAVVTYGDVPAGDYTLQWDCNGLAFAKRNITVIGKTNPPSTPHKIPNNSAPDGHSDSA